MLFNLFLGSAALALVATPIYMYILHLIAKRREEEKTALQRIAARRERR